MKVTDKRKVNTDISFENVKEGAMFAYRTQYDILFCEKTFTKPIQQIHSDNPLYINAVDLKSGNLLYFDDDAIVTLVDAEVIIDYYGLTTQESN